MNNTSGINTQLYQPPKQIAAAQCPKPVTLAVHEDL